MIFSKIFRKPYHFPNLAGFSRGSVYNQFLRRYQKPSTPRAGFNEGAEHRKYLWIANASLFAAVFGIIFLSVPFYKAVCSASGLTGDTYQKDYSAGRTAKDNPLILHRKFRVMFTSEVDPELNWDFEPIQRTLEINAGEPALMFYKVRNNGTKPVVGISLYSMFPEDTGWYFSKIQCFCFNQQLVAPGEEINLPLYFYLEPEIVEDPYLSSTKDITVIYKFYPAKNQDLAKWVEDQSNWEYEQKKYIREKRITKGTESGTNVDDLVNEANEDKILHESSMKNIKKNPPKLIKAAIEA